MKISTALSSGLYYKKTYLFHTKNESSYEVNFIKIEDKENTICCLNGNNKLKQMVKAQDGRMSKYDKNTTASALLFKHQNTFNTYEMTAVYKTSPDGFVTHKTSVIPYGPNTDCEYLELNDNMQELFLFSKQFD